MAEIEAIRLRRCEVPPLRARHAPEASKRPWAADRAAIFFFVHNHMLSAASDIHVYLKHNQLSNLELNYFELIYKSAIKR